MDYALELTLKFKNSSDGEAAKTAAYLVRVLNTLAPSLYYADELLLHNDSERRQVGLDGKPVLRVLSRTGPGTDENGPGQERARNASEEVKQEGDQGEGDHEAAGDQG